MLIGNDWSAHEYRHYSRNAPVRPQGHRVIDWSRRPCIIVQCESLKHHLTAAVVVGILSWIKRIRWRKVVLQDQFDLIRNDTPAQPAVP
jgi:hypothetical protein